MASIVFTFTPLTLALKYMLSKKKPHPAEKIQLHPRNKHRERYNFKELIHGCQDLAPYIAVNRYGDESIDFFNPTAVKMLNKALLKYFYKVDDWDIPSGYLCPPIPGRADYIHYIADLLAEGNGNKVPIGGQIKCLDVGVGANCVYPIIGHQAYGWQFVGTDIDPVALSSANHIINHNFFLKGQVELRLQSNPKDIYNGIIKADDRFDVTICNPPFHISAAQANVGAVRKINNLTGQKTSRPILNFAGKNNELWCEGGEERFIKTMVVQSKQFTTSCNWFTTLVSQKKHLEGIYITLKEVGAVAVKTIDMGQGNKISRIVAWRF